MSKFSFGPYFSNSDEDHSSSDLQSQNLSQIITGHLDNIDPSHEQLIMYEKSARDQYEQLIIRNNWKNVLTKTASLLAEKYKNELSTQNNSNNNKTQFSIGYDKKIKTITNSQVLTVGRYKENDIIVSNPSASRLHIIIFLIYPKIIVVDLASLVGTKTVARSSDKLLEHVEPKSRKVLEFDWDEHVILELGIENIITFFPKECIVCQEGPRTIKLSCGHYILCVECYKLKDKYQNMCPLCKSIIDSQFVEEDVYQNNTYMNEDMDEYMNDDVNDDVNDDTNNKTNNL